jgi:peptidoglycan hydrolase-like protein with peptidoglycan-binding domain
MKLAARHTIVLSILIAAGIGISPAAQAAGFSPVTQQAQSKLTALGFTPGPSDGILGRNTITAIKAFQKKSGLPETGILDSATLAKLDTGAQTSQAPATPQTAQTPQSTTVSDWRAVPAQDELDKLTANPVNDPGSPYTDYRPNAPAANLDLPGAAIVTAMKTSSDTFGSGPPGTPKSTPKAHKAMTDCLNTRPTHWSDLTLHYYCQMAQPRQCFTYALRGKSTPGGVKYSRTEAYKGCATGTLPYSPFFAFVTKTQPQIFQYVMFGQTNAFKPEQEQAIINAFYGVTNPADPKECRLKRPRRAEDPADGTHCLANKTMAPPLVGKGT